MQLVLTYLHKTKHNLNGLLILFYKTPVCHFAEMSAILPLFCINSVNELTIFTLLTSQIPYGLAVRIPGFHPGGPGSTPGMGKTKFFFLSHFF